MGAPQCPAGLSAFGETCIAAQAAPVVVQPVAPPPPPLLPPVVQVPVVPVSAIVGYQAHFQSDDGDFTVSVDSGPGCRTPCELVVPPGHHRLRVNGDASFRESMDFPASPSVVRIDRRHGGRVAMGVVGLAVGIPVVVTGLALTLLAVTWEDYNLVGDTHYENGRRLLPIGVGLAIGGAVFAGVLGGVGFGTAGHNRASFDSMGSRDADAPVRLVGLGVTPTRGGAALGATIAF
jgi:hypothetical protein